MTTALVFGASGYLGSRVCEGLRAGGIDTVEAGRSARRGAMHGGFAVDLVTGDPDSVARAVHESGAGLVVNCAGRTIGPTEDLVRLNVLGFARLLSAVEAASTRPRLIHLASAAEYGRTPEGAAVDESAPTRPAGPYGVTKLAATQLLALSRAQGRVDGLALRVFNVLGPDMPEHTLPGSILSRILQAKVAGLASIETGPLGAVRDFVDVRDVVQAVVAAATCAPTLVAVVNIGSGEGHTAEELVGGIARRLGYRGEVRPSGTGSPRSADVSWQVADIGLARDVLGWTPQCSFEDACDAVAGARGTGDGDRR